MKRVLILQHVWENPLGYLGEMLQERNIAYDVIDVETEPIPDPAAYNALIALGGSQHVYADDPYFARERAVLRQVIEQDIPFLGICLGGQLLAQVLGGVVKRHTMTELGFFDVQFTEEGKSDPLYAGLPGYQKVFHWHEDTFDLPSGATLLATSEHTENQAFRYGWRAYGLQYHIELDPAMLDTWLHHPAFKQEMTNTRGIDAYQAIEHEHALLYSLYREHTRILFENFLRISELL